MRRTKRLILRIWLSIPIALCALLVLQSAKVVPPVGIGLGNAAKSRGYDAGLNGEIVFRTATGMKQPTISGATYGVRTLGEFDAAGVYYRRWQMILQKPDRTPLPGDLGTFTEVRLGLGLVLPLSLATIAICLWLLARERRQWLAGREHLCRGCGYDLRATPDRCPECGLDVTKNSVEGAV